MLAEQLKTIGMPFYAPRYWLELWDLGNRPVSFGGFEAVNAGLIPGQRGGVNAGQ